MNEQIKKLKTVLLNRNTIMILGVIAGVIVLWLAYTIVLGKAVDPQRVPVAVRDITAGTIITRDDITYVEVNPEVLKKAKVITSSSALIDYYVANGTSIPAGAMFYKDQVVEKSVLIERDVELAPKGYYIYRLKVDNNVTYANSIYPGDKIDLWLKTTVEGSLVYEEFIKSIDVLSVKDASGRNVFDTAEAGTPAWISFAVPREMFEYLKRVEYISSMQLFPVPRNRLYTEEGAETEYSNTRLLDYINSLTRPVSGGSNEDTQE